MTTVCETTIDSPLSSDRAIHVWANRGSGFESNRYAQDLNFSIFENPGRLWTDIRKYLMLDREDTDRFLAIGQIILSNYTGLEAKIKDNKFTQRVENLPLPGIPTIKEGSIVNNGNRYSFFKKYKYKFPIPKEYKISWSSEGSVRIDSGLGNIADVPAKIVQMFGDPPKPLGFSNIIGDWGDELPFEGILRYGGFWDLGSTMTVEYIPQDIDYGAWINSIESNLHFSGFLEGLNLHEQYTLAKEPTEKLAVLYLSLVLY